MPRKALPRPKEAAEDLDTVKIFRENLRHLVKAAQNGDPPDRRITQEGFAQAAGMSLRALANHISESNDRAYAVTLRTVERVAKGFGIEPWMLLVKDFPSEITLNDELRKQTREHVQRYLHASPAVRAGLAEMLPAPDRKSLLK